MQLVYNELFVARVCQDVADRWESLDFNYAFMQNQREIVDGGISIGAFR